MNIIVYTAIFGNIDCLWPALPDDSAKYICFSDRPKAEQGLWTQRDSRPDIICGQFDAIHPVWEVRVVEPQYGSRKTARYYKILPPEADVTIWLDGNVRLLIPAQKAVEQWLKAGSLATFNHPDRECLYDEAAFCIEKGKDTRKQLIAQMTAYRKAGMPKRWGLAETRCMIRRNTPAIKNLNEMWWTQLDRYSIRDQVSLPYCCWKLGLKWKVVPGRTAPKSLKRLNKAFWFTKHTKGKP